MIQTKLKTYPPTSPGRRQAEFVNWRKVLTKTSGPEKRLTWGRKRDVGRNSQGRITTRHKGSGVKRLWREIDFKYDKIAVPARVVSLEYDPNRSSFIALLHYHDGEKRYVLAPQDVAVGSMVVSGPDAPIEPGNRMPLHRIPVGTMVYNIELQAGHGAQIARSAGVGALVLAQEGGYANIQMPSKEVRMIHAQNFASIGTLSNPMHSFITIGTAGRNRRKGIRPSVRGTAMNPVDHPHGGGEGRTQVGRRRGPATPWGKLARGVKTRKRKKTSSRFILSRRKK